MVLDEMPPTFIYSLTELKCDEQLLHWPANDWHFTEGRQHKHTCLQMIQCPNCFTIQFV